MRNNQTYIQLPERLAHLSNYMGALTENTLKLPKTIWHIEVFKGDSIKPRELQLPLSKNYRSLNSENFFRNRIKSNRNQIVFTIFRLI